jgi:predicted RNase H-like HicB family nuclease
MTESKLTMEERVALMRLPWSVRVERDEDNGLVARVAEIEDAIATGEDEKALALDLWEAIQASLTARLEHGDQVPLPKGYRLPWENPRRFAPAKVIKLQAKGRAWEESEDRVIAKSSAQTSFRGLQPQTT